MRLIDTPLKLAAATIIGATVLALGARFWWIFELATHFRVQYLAAAAALLALLVARRQYRWAGALALASVLNMVPVLPYLSLTPTAAAYSPGAPLKILAVNVSHGDFSAARLLEIQREAAPDVLIVVEFTAHAERLLGPTLDADYPHSLKLPARRRDGIAMWSRHPFATVERVQLDRTTAIEGKVMAPGGAFTVLGVHLSAPMRPRRAADRNRELDLLAERLASVDGPIVVAGDFNITPYSPFFTDWLSDTGLVDARRGRTISISWPTLLPILGIPIDHCVVSDEFAVIAHRRLPDFGSDHYAILAELALRAPNHAP
jgi:endonuclease/exonuclease/phosphatase (EEP) superfamily protein YafD